MKINMTDEHIRSVARRLLGDIAPEVDLENLDPDVACTRSRQPGELRDAARPWPG
jgi:hypothetical protein